MPHSLLWGGFTIGDFVAFCCAGLSIIGKSVGSADKLSSDISCICENSMVVSSIG